MKNRDELRREIVERATALTMQQLQRQQQRSEQQQQRRGALASPQRLTGSFAAGLTLGLLALRRRRKRSAAIAESAEAPRPTLTSTRSALLSRTAHELLPIVQPLLLTAAAQWWQRRHTADDDDTPANAQERPPGK